MKKNIICLVVLSIVYIPIILFDLYMVVGNGICYPCGCWDIVCQVKREGYDILFGYLLFILFILLLNLLFLIPLFTFAKNILTEIKKPYKEGGKN